MSTLRQLADRLGVSIATVSRALNDKPGVSTKVRQRVLQLAQELRYHPNQAARSLATSHNPHVLFIIHRRQFSEAEDPFYPNIVQGLEEVLSSEGYGIMLVMLSDSQMAAGPTEVRAIQEQRPSAIVLAGPDISSSFILATASSGIHTMLVDNALHNTSLPAVLPNNKEGCQAATNHLIQDHRHQHIALLRGPEGWISSDERAAGYLSEMEAAGFQPFILTANDTTIQTGQEAAIQALEVKPETTAIVAINDAMAIGALRASRQMGRSVPGDLAVVGFDNISWAVYADPPLTTVSVPMVDMGRLAARVLLDRINGTLTAATRTIAAAQLVIRASCGCKGATEIIVNQTSNILENTEVRV